MVIEALYLLAGMTMLLLGGDILVRGASALAKALGVSPLVVGLTVVAFGTSAPELSVNLTAALTGSGDISFGNIIGSNIANIGLILGVAALIKPIKIDSIVITREIPMMLLASAATVIMGIDAQLRQPPDIVDRADGLLLLLLFSVFIYYTVSEVIRNRQADAFVRQASGSPPRVKAQSIAWNLLVVAAGLTALIFGGTLTVDGAVRLADALGMPKSVIGLTVVAIGTSLPELATSVLAALKGHAELAIGNVVGSNIFNLLLVTGLTAAIKPIPIPAGGTADLLVMLAFSVILLPLAISDRFRIVRTEGAVLLFLYLAFTCWRAAC